LRASLEAGTALRAAQRLHIPSCPKHSATLTQKSGIKYRITGKLTGL
jgi:hypothetical protein